MKSFAFSKEKAVQLFKERGESYKVEILEGIPDNEVSIYRQGDFVDLCRGPHLASTKGVKAFNSHHFVNDGHYSLEHRAHAALAEFTNDLIFANLFHGFSPLTWQHWMSENWFYLTDVSWFQHRSGELVFKVYLQGFAKSHTWPSCPANHGAAPQSLG